MLPFTLPEAIIIVQGTVYLLLTCIALLRQKAHPRSARVLMLYTLLSLAWLAAQLALGKTWLPFLMDDFVARLPLYGLLLMAVVFLWFTWIYQRVEGTSWGWWVLGLAWISILLLVDSNLVTSAQVLWTGGGWMILRQDFILSGIGLGWCVFMSAASITTLQQYRHSQQPLQRNRSRYMAAVTLLIVAGEATFLAAYWTLGGLLRLSGVLLAAFAALTVRLPSFRRALLRSLSYLITTGLALLFYLGALMGVRWVFGVVSAYPLWLLIGALAVILAVLFNPLLNQMQRWLDRLIAGVSHDPRRVLRQYSQTISNILDLSLLAKVVIELIGDALDISSGRLFTVTHEKDPEGCNCFRLLAIQGTRENKPEAAVLDEASPLADYFLYHNAPLVQSDIDSLARFERTPTAERQWISDLQMELFVPIHSQDEWIGLLALGPKNSGEPFWDDDQFLLSTLADQTAVALENARLVESLIRLNNDFRRAITALDQANRNLEQLDRTKTEFISVASHELRTPLTLVNGYSQMLLDEPDLASDPLYATMLSGIRNGAQRLHEVLESMLDMARIDTRELQLDLQPVALGKIIQEIHAELEPALNDRHQSFEAQELDSLPPIQADGGALRKVFYHLLINAIKYTPDGGHITVSGHAVYPTAERLIESGVEIVVSDTGVGIDPGMHEVIFTKFYQTGELALHSTGKTKFKGSGPGLGLAIAKGFVEAHFGRIWVESPSHDEGCCPGSEFYVFLPLHQPEKTRPRSIL
jgi:signal transduction histidine kinase